MSAALVGHGRRLLSTALARAAAFVIEPVEPPPRAATIRPRPVVAVVGLGPRCGTTTVARALAVELAAADLAGAAVVAGAAAGGRALPGGVAAARLARAVGMPTGRELRPVGRVWLVAGGDEDRLSQAVRHLAPLVLDVGHGQPAGVAAALADHLLLIASTAVEPALASVVAGSLARIGPAPVVVLNHGGQAASETDVWAGRAEAAVERSPLGARLARAGRHPRASLGDDLFDLAAACQAVGSHW